MQLDQINITACLFSLFPQISNDTKQLIKAGSRIGLLCYHHSYCTVNNVWYA